LLLATVSLATLMVSALSAPLVREHIYQQLKVRVESLNRQRH
jgi:hypothetical protein